MDREQIRVQEHLEYNEESGVDKAGHIMRCIDNRWTITVTEWQSREGKRKQGKQRTR